MPILRRFKKLFGLLAIFPNYLILFRYLFLSDDMRHIRNYRAVLMEVVNFERQPLEEDLNISGVSMDRWLSKTRSAKVCGFHAQITS